MAPSLISHAESIVRDVSLRCPVCDEWFDTYMKKDTHQRTLGHFQCSVCKLKFRDNYSVVDHVVREHKTVHDIKCPGCLKEFKRAGAWVAHVESYECTRIFPETLEARQKKRQVFTDALAGLGDSPVSLGGRSTAGYQSDTWKDDPILNTLDGHDNFRPHQGETTDQNYTKPEDFPRLATQEYRAGGSKQPDLLTADAPVPKPLQTNNAWAQKKDLFPKAQEKKEPAKPTWASALRSSDRAQPSANGQSPSQAWDRNVKVQVAKATTIFPERADPWAGMQQAHSSSDERILDPDHPNFDAGIFYEPILEQFKCPHGSCNKKFKTAQSLAAHLTSAAHRGDKITCPACRRNFTSKTAMVQHMESSRCGIRESDQFRGLLARMTGGILDVEPESTLEDRANPETMARDMPRVFVDEAAFAELRVTPTERHVPGAELRENSTQKQKGAGAAADAGAGASTGDVSLPKAPQNQRQKRFW